MMHDEPLYYEVLINAVVTAQSSAEAREVVEGGRWLNYVDDYGDQHGKIVHLFPTQQLTRVTKFAVVGDPIPLLMVDGERLDQFTYRRYAVGVLLVVRAVTESDAANYITNRGWLSTDAKIDISATSGPARLGAYENIVGVLHI